VKEEGKKKLETKLARYCDFWNALVPLLKQSQVFVLATSKQPAFSLIGRKVIETLQPSPTSHQLIILGNLETNHIEEIMKNTEISVSAQTTTNIYEHLCSAQSLEETLVDFLCDYIYERTAGLPRLIQYCLEGLCNSSITLDSERNIKKAIDWDAYRHIINYRGAEAFISPKVLDNGWYDAYVSLLFWFRKRTN